MKKVAVIGGGIVGSTTAYYLHKYGWDVTVYDEGTGQATKAAVGIICPWVSQRRNRIWYEMVREGAEFYPEFVREIGATDAYFPNGSLITHSTRLEALYELARVRQQTAPQMGTIRLLGKDELERMMPAVKLDEALWIEGAAYVDGDRLQGYLKNLLVQNCVKFIRETVQFKQAGGRYWVAGAEYEAVVVAAGAWTAQVFAEYDVAVMPQKGQLIEFSKTITPGMYPSLLPQGEVDLVITPQGDVVVGASHENNKGYDLHPDPCVAETLKQQGSHWMPSLSQKVISKVRVGTRAHTPDFTPFYGRLLDAPRCYVAGGLGSTGLTSGPLIGFKMAKMLSGMMAYETLRGPDAYFKRK